MFLTVALVYLFAWVCNAYAARNYGGFFAKLPYLVLFFSPFAVVSTMETTLYWTIGVIAGVYGGVILNAILRLCYRPEVETPLLVEDLGNFSTYQQTRLKGDAAASYWLDQIGLAVWMAVCVVLLLVFFPDKEKRPQFWRPGESQQPPQEKPALKRDSTQTPKRTRPVALTGLVHFSHPLRRDKLLAADYMSG